jgi:hypothetical protein
VRFEVLSEHPCRRGNEHEAAIALCFHHPVGRLCQVEAAVQVHTQHASPVVDRQFVERDAVEDSGIADHRVDPAELIECGLHNCPTALGTVHRIMRSHRCATGRDDLRDDVVGDGGVGTLTAHGAAEIVDHHRCAAAGEFSRIEATESAARTGHHRDLAGEVDHVLLLAN